jgi:hypothetical protein
MSLEHRFTFLGNARAKRFHAWPVSHSMLVAIFTIHPSAHWNVHPCTLSLIMHDMLDLFQSQALRPQALLVTFAIIMSWPYYKALSKPQTF